MNFGRVVDQNLPKLVQETGLPRQDVINIYTRFISVYMLQQLDNPEYKSIDLADLRRVNHKLLTMTGKGIKLQSTQVIERMLEMMALASDKGQLSWEKFSAMIK